MKRLGKHLFRINDSVKFKKHPYDDSTYKIIQIFDDNTYFIDNGKLSYTNIKESALEPVEKGDIKIG